MTIKKQFVELYTYLVENKDCVVEDLLDHIESYCSKQTDSKYIKDSDGNIVAIFDYYFKRWLPTSTVEFGSKASNKATGLNTMCKMGNKLWTQQQNEAKTKKDEVLEKLMSGDIDRDEAKNLLDDIEVERNRIQMELCPEDNFETEEEVLEFLEN